jgi:hypothetical protein
MASPSASNPVGVCDQRVSEQPLRAADSGLGCRLLEHALRRDTARRQGGGQPEQDAADQRDRNRERQGRHIDVNVEVRGPDVVQHTRREEADQRSGRDRTAQAADGEHHHRFGDQLRDEPCTRRSEREPGGQLGPARRAACEQEARDVGACRQEHQ